MLFTTKNFALVAAVLSTVNALAVKEDWVLDLVKRQEPGTPLYACHLACGMSPCHEIVLQ